MKKETIIFLFILSIIFVGLITFANSKIKGLEEEKILLEEELNIKYQEGLDQGRIEGSSGVINFIGQQIKEKGYLTIKVGQNERGEDLLMYLSPVKVNQTENE